MKTHQTAAREINARTFQQLTGLSIGRMQRWSEAGTLQPETSGRGKCHGRRFSMRDVIRARFMLELLERGLTTPAARNLMRRVIPEFLDELTAGTAADLVVLISGPGRLAGGRYRIQDPRPRLLPTAAAVKAMTENAGASFLIPVSEMSEQLRDRYERTKLNAFQ